MTLLSALTDANIMHVVGQLTHVRRNTTDSIGFRIASPEGGSETQGHPTEESQPAQRPSSQRSSFSSDPFERAEDPVHESSEETVLRVDWANCGPGTILIPVVARTPDVQQELGQPAKNPSVGATVVHEAAEWLPKRTIGVQAPTPQRLSKSAA